jgi:hypothetical protein
LRRILIVVGDLERIASKERRRRYNGGRGYHHARARGCEVAGVRIAAGDAVAEELQEAILMNNGGWANNQGG